MKLRCSSILKAALALVLAVILLAGTTVTGFSAIVDELAKTGAVSQLSTVGTVRTTPYYIQKQWDSWGVSQMTMSPKGYYCYYEVPYCQYDRVFKIWDNANYGAGYNDSSYYISDGFWSSNAFKNNVSSHYTWWDSSNSGYGFKDGSGFGEDKTCYVVVYFHGTELHNSEDVHPAVCVYDYLPDEDYTVKLGHSFGASWEDVNMTESSGIWSHTLTDLGASVTGDFCIKEKFGSFWERIYKSNTYITKSNKSVTLNTSENNCHLTTHAAGNYAFNYDFSTKEISVTFPTAYDVTFNLNGHSSGTPLSQLILGGGKATEPDDPVAPGFEFQGWYTNNEFTTPWDFDDVVTADLDLVAKWSEYQTKARQTFYFDKTAYAEGFSGTPSFQFSKDGTDDAASVSGWLTGQTITNRTNVYYVEAPAGYSYLRVKDESETPLNSDWGRITNAQATTITFDNNGDKFHGPALPYTDHYNNTSFAGENGVVYFDNTITNWNINSTNKLYFVIGNTDYYSMIEMTEVPDTDGLYYIDPSSWTNYTYFAFALATGIPSNTHANPGETDGILNNSIACTTLISVYDLTRGEKNKSFIGFGLDNTDHPVLDILWISDKTINGDGYSTTYYTVTDPDLTTYKTSGNAFEGDYLNRGIDLDVTGGAVTISGKKLVTYKTTGDGSTVNATDGNYYFARTSTVTLTGIGDRKVKVGDNAWAGKTSDANDGTFTFTVPGGTESDYAPVPVLVSPVGNVNVGIAVLGLGGITQQGKCTDANIGTVSYIKDLSVDATFIHASDDNANNYTGEVAQCYLDSNGTGAGQSENLKLTRTLVEGNAFVGWIEASDPNNILDTGDTYYPTSAGTYYAVYSHPVTYRFSYTGRDNTTKYYDMTATDGASYTELSTGEVDVLTRADDITTKGNSVSSLVSVFNTTLNFYTRVGTTAGYPLTATISSRNDETVSTQNSYNLNLYTKFVDGSSTSSYATGGDNHSPFATVSGIYSTPIDLTAMALYNGDEEVKRAGLSVADHAKAEGETFYCWRKINTTTGDLGEIVSTQANFGLSLTGNLDIVPVFGTGSRADYLNSQAGDNHWKAYVDRSEVTKEVVTSGASDLYNDTIVRFSDLTNTSNPIGANYTEYGVVILVQDQTSKGTKSDAFTACNTSATALGYLKALKNNNKTNAKMNSDTYGTAYAIYIPTTALSNLNRAEICMILDNTKFSGGQYIVASYAYKPAESGESEKYIISDSERHDM